MTGWVVDGNRTVYPRGEIRESKYIDAANVYCAGIALVHSGAALFWSGAANLARTAQVLVRSRLSIQSRFLVSKLLQG